MMAEEEGAPPPRFGMLRLIALYKLVKVVLLLLAAYFELRLHDASLSSKFVTWVEARPAGLEHSVINWLVKSLSGMSENKIHALRLFTFAYAAIFAIEGVGLWMQKRWAEWVTTLVTGSLIPLEVWEFIVRPNLGKAAVVIANVAILIFLIWHVMTKGRRGAGDRPTRVVSGPDVRV